MSENQTKKLTLVLGGGGAKSFTHLGIIDVFQRIGIPIDSLVTCSGGSVIGALIASGVPIAEIKEEFYRIIRRINWFQINLSKKGFLSQHNVRQIIRGLGANINIEQTKVPIKIVATNLNLGRLEIFRAGSLEKAVCASVAFPGLYKPVVIDDYLYADGGILDAIPADIARQENGGLVVSINLDGSLADKIDTTNIFQLVHRSIYIPLIIQRKKIVLENSDVVIEPFSLLEFNIRNWADIFRFHSKKRMEYFYQIGVDAANKQVDKIKSLLTS